MEQERHLAYRYLAVGLALALPLVFLLLLWVGLPGKPVAAPIAVKFTPGNGHLGDFYTPNFTVAFVTNTTQRAVRLELPEVQWEETGRFTAMDFDWGGTNGFCFLGANEVMPLPFKIPSNSTKFRIKFEYSQEAGHLQRILHPALNRLFFPRPVPRRLVERGWLDGRLHFGYTGGWETNQ